MYSKLMKCCTNKDLGLLIIRLGIAIIFAYAGYMKLAHVDQMAGFFSSLGLPVFMVYVVGGLEVLGALAMVLGYMTKVMGAILSIILVVAIILVKAKMGFVAAEIDIMALAATLGIALIGPGAWAIPCGAKCDNCDSCSGGICTNHEGK